MRILNSYEVSSMIDEIEQDVRNKYDLEDNWYGDCYPDEIHDLGIKIRVCNNEEEFEYLKTKVKELFERWAKDCVMEG
ncbi:MULTISPECIES: hypothetical protein [Erysipelotrichales]|uniref:Uncharacterized protein n=1 Tax=Amedibacterium intestinale TaxID=2583452 RepID=A0A6N4THJ1_9FIRM|nr:hypothetical protein [Amedibacterium intestinale]RHO24545.1 hypothetical protein DW220_00060 [Eubacterium sp. AM18-26]RHO28879.1 hypothetical protein DW212_00690 [Eubacterium sp. AM18-10LB-B]BBK22676.1 hypothetical protein Aargi30884_15790 [Amedibacterium intestinale]